MKALKVILLVILAIVVLLLIVGLFLPKSAHVEGSTTIDAPAKIVFKQVNHLKSWDNWSPWIEEDPNMIETFEGPEEGVGAMYLWEMGGGERGKLTIMESIPYEKIVNELDFYDQGRATDSWTFVEGDDGTKVTWVMNMSGFSYPFEVYFGLILDVMMKPYFDKGLSNLKEFCESIPEEIMPTNTDISETQIESLPALAIKDSAQISGLPDKMVEVYTELETYMKEAGIEMTGPPYSVYIKWDPESWTVFEAGFPVPETAEGKGRIFLTQSPGGKAITVYHYGAYTTLGDSWKLIEEYAKANEKVMAGSPWEVYLTDPTVVKDTSKWVTQIVYPVE